MNMRTFFVVLMIVATTAFTIAQITESGDQSSRPAGLRVHTGAELSSTIAYGSFSLGDENRFGPVLTLQYSPSRHALPAIDFFAGVLIQTGSSGPVDERNLVPAASFFAPYYSPFSDYRNDNEFHSPNFSIGLAFLGSDVTFYLLDGSVRPYVGFGGSLAFWSFSNRYSGTVTPDAKAGLDVRVSSSFSGFIEVRHMIGVPNLFGWDTPKFDGMTSAAIGVSFAPRLR